MSDKPEYIERGALIERLESVVVTDDLYGMGIQRGLEIAIDCAKEKPAADVEPVVRGELRINEQGYLECSACGKTLRIPLTSTGEMKRCYFCGAHIERSGDI